MSKDNFYNITNIKDDNLLVYSFKNKRFSCKKKKDINFNIQNDKYSSNFLIKQIKLNHYKLYFKYLKMLKYSNIILLFSSNKIDNPLFFNIIHIIDGEYYLIYINKNKIIYKLIDYNKEIKFNNNSEYVFHFIDKNVNICKVNMNNKEYSVYGYNKLPNIRDNKNNYCKYNKELSNSWRVNTYINPLCNYINIDKNIKNTLNKCSNNNYQYLLRKLPNELESLDIVKNHLNKMSAGQIEEKINVNSKIIKDKIGNQEIEEQDNKINNIYEGPYKVVLGNTLEKFSLYLSEGNFKDIFEARKEYIKIVNTVYERQKEYQLASKFSVCSGNMIEEIHGVSNLIDCQTLCNNKDSKCKYISYDRNNKKCKLYNSCKLFYNKNFNTYTKKSLLRADGYNLLEALYREKDPSVSQTPYQIKYFLYFSSICVTILLSLLFYRFIKIFYKLFMCMYDDNCKAPLELFNSDILNERYI
jgi:hypothetical protein